MKADLLMVDCEDGLVGGGLRPIFFRSSCIALLVHSLAFV